MPAAAPQALNGTTKSRVSSLPNGSATSGNSHNHGNMQSPQPTQLSPSTAVASTKSKKTKSKKAADSNETGKLLAAKISQLELDAAGEKDQEQEIEREVRKATRDLNNLLSAMGTPIERMEVLQKRITDLIHDMKRVERDYIKGKKRSDQMQRERDAARVELNKSNSVKEKLEKLAREFTKDNKKLKEDLKRLEDSEKKSKDALAERDSASLEELQMLMERNGGLEKRSSSPEVDEMFRQKFKSFFDQYNLRELHFLSILRAKDSEIQHHLARLENQRKVVDNESTRARQLTTQVSTFSQTETELRSQLNIYVEKFKQVEDTLNNSNDLFLTFRKEMEEMSKKTKRLEKENLTLTRKHDLTNRNILEMAEERTRMTKDLENSRKKITTLESIIRHMQDQGRSGNPGALAAIGVDQDETESEYEDSEEDGEYGMGSEEVDYEDDDTEEDIAQQRRASGPIQGSFDSAMPPPPPLMDTGHKAAIPASSVNGNVPVNGA